MTTKDIPKKDLKKKNSTTPELKETDASILWNANPNKPASESSKAKNTPIVKIKYKRENHTYEISLEFNRPNDYNNNLKQN